MESLGSIASAVCLRPAHGSCRSSSRIQQLVSSSSVYSFHCIHCGYALTDVHKPRASLQHISSLLHLQSPFLTDMGPKNVFPTSRRIEAVCMMYFPLSISDTYTGYWDFMIFLSPYVRVRCPRIHLYIRELTVKQQSIAPCSPLVRQLVNKDGTSWWDTQTGRLSRGGMHRERERERGDPVSPLPSKNIGGSQTAKRSHKPTFIFFKVRGKVIKL
jgi:hypothetical protein